MRLSHIDRLRNKLKSSLPGWEAQKVLSPVASRQYLEGYENARDAGVLVLLFPDKSEKLSVVYIKRTHFNSGDKHGGQLSFPGGKRETVDNDIEQTALREANEEIGVDPADIDIIGHLSSLYVFVSNFMIYPSVGYLDYTPEFVPEASEVDYVVTEYVESLVHPDTVRRKNLNVRGNTLLDVPYYHISGETLWGATAMITSELVHIIREL